MLWFAFQLIYGWPNTTSKGMIGNFQIQSHPISKYREEKKISNETPPKIIATQNLEQNNQVYVR